MMTHLSRRQSLAAIGLGATGLAACTAPGPGSAPTGELPEGVDMGLVARNSAVFWFEGVNAGDKPRHHLEFFWSPSCMFSARHFADRIHPLLADPAFSRRHSVSAHLMARNSTDIALFKALRRYREFGLLSAGLMLRSATGGGLAGKTDIAEMARRAGAEVVNRKVDEKHALILTDWARTTRKVDATPATFLDGKRITIT